MDNNSDTLYSRLISWLLQESVPATASPVDGQDLDPVPISEPTVADFEIESLDPLDSEDLNIVPFNTSNADSNRTRTGSQGFRTHDEIQSSGSNRPYNLGEMPTVENRFQAILKRRLKVEIESHPPLFPWETEISDYETETCDALSDRWVPLVRMWMPQLSNLSLPIPMPEVILAKLLEACSEAAYSRQQLGAKLVNAVENLFPDQFQSLNNLAGMVLLSSTGRGKTNSSGSSELEPLQPLEQLASMPYEEASAEQQMVLAMLAAKEIISALTVPISPTKTPVEREWQTAAGTVTVQAEYQMEDGVPKLRVTAHLPRGGTLTLRTPQASATSQRTYPGYLSVESFDLQPNQTYPLEIRFYDLEQSPLIFSICPTV